MKSPFLSLLFLLLCCQLSSQISFTITPTICKNDTTQLTANTGSLTNCTFTWISNPVGASFSSPNNSVTNISFVNAGTYTIVSAVTSGTINSLTQNTITAASLPVITLAQSGFTTCITSNIPLFSKPILLSASGGITYTWSPPIPPFAGNPNGPSNGVRPAVNACFSVTGQDANGCKSKAATCVTVIPRFTISITPTAATICKSNFSGQDQAAELTAGNPSPPAFLSAYDAYHWYEGIIGGILTSPFSASVAIAPSVTATYTVELRDSLNCVSLKATVTVSVVNCTGVLKNSFQEEDLSVYPNPVKDKLTLDFGSEVTKPLKLTVTNCLGQIVYIAETLFLKQEIDFSFLSSGIYYLLLQNNLEQKTFKIIKE